MDLSIRDELDALPRWAIVAFAARCARRVEPLFRKGWPAAPRDFCWAVSAAVECAESCAAEASSQAVFARMLAREADIASHRAAFGPAEVCASSAHPAAHAAANAAGTVAYLDEATMGAYYAASDAAEALAATGQAHDAILADLELLTISARKHGWTDSTPVSPELFAPLPPVPSEDEAARLEAYHAWERASRPSLSPEEQREMYFEALGRVRGAR